MNILFIQDEEYLHDILFCLKTCEDQTLVIIGNSPAFAATKAALAIVANPKIEPFTTLKEELKLNQTKEWQNRTSFLNRSIQTKLRQK